LTDVPFIPGSDTSEGAADSYRPKAAGDEARVLDFISSRGETGATDQETRAALDMQLSTVQARRIGLRDKGLVCDSGLRRPTPAGRSAAVWIKGTETKEVQHTTSHRVSRPNPQELGVCLVSIKKLALHAKDTNGPEIPDELRRLWKWLEWISQ